MHFKYIISALILDSGGPTQERLRSFLNIAEWDKFAIHPMPPHPQNAVDVFESLGPYYTSIDVAVKCVVLHLVFNSYHSITKQDLILCLKNIVTNPHNQLCSPQWFDNYCSLRVLVNQRLRGSSVADTSDHRLWRFFKRKRDEWYSVFPYVFHLQSPLYSLSAMNTSVFGQEITQRDSIFGICGW